MSRRVATRSGGWCPNFNFRYRPIPALAMLDGLSRKRPFNELLGNTIDLLLEGIYDEAFSKNAISVTERRASGKAK